MSSTDSFAHYPDSRPPSVFERLGYGREDILSRLERNWYEMFEGPNKIYWESDDDLGYVMDTGNNDVRTEGMSYAMMLAVQYDHRNVFDRIWGWAVRHMRMDGGDNAGYFAWSVQPDGTKNSLGPASDGEEYFAMALLLAARRWQGGYARQARELLDICLHKGEPGQSETTPDGKPNPKFRGRAMWDPDNHQIRFVSDVDWTDPSYHLPHFYEQFERFAATYSEADWLFWKAAAKASRAHLVNAVNAQTGLNPEYADFDGTPHAVDWGEHTWFYSDAYRTAGNIGLDVLWGAASGDVADGGSAADGDATIGGGASLELCNRVAALQRFLLTHDRTSVYAVDGTPFDEVVLHPVGLIAATAEGSIAAEHADPDRFPDAKRNARAWVDLLWNTPIRIGRRRYYDNFLYAFAFLALAGEYRFEWDDRADSNTNNDCKEN